MRHILLTGGKKAIVDNDVFEKLSGVTLFSCGGRGKYAGFCKKTNQKYITILLHREVLNAKPKEIVDHINRNPLDCRRKNLRIVSHRQNILNSAVLERRKAGVRGTFFDKRKNGWCARVRIGGTRKFFGYFKTQKEASAIYESVLKKYSTV